MPQKKGLDPSCLPEGVSFDRREGLYAQLGPEGQVLHLGVYDNGQRKYGTWALNVALDGRWARVDRKVTLSQVWTESPSPPGTQKQELQDWLSPWLAKIAGDTHNPTSNVPFFCSFCEKSLVEVRSLIGGANSYICDECVELCNDILREKREE